MATIWQNVLVRLEAMIERTWITLPKYCAEFGETVKAVRRRREKGEWLDGRHTQVRNRRIWVNIEAAQRWVTTGQ